MTLLVNIRDRESLNGVVQITIDERNQLLALAENAAGGTKDLDQRKLVECCRRLVKLMEDPHPGLSTWNLFCLDTVREMRGLFAESKP